MPTPSASATTEARLRHELVYFGRLLYERGLVVGVDGNLSARLPDGSLLITPSGLCKGRLDESQLLHLDASGRPIGGGVEAPDSPAESSTSGASAALDPGTATNALPEQGHLRPSSELAMHLEAYRQRPDADAVIHAHPPHLIAMSMLSGGLDAAILPEALLYVGQPPVLAYARPSSDEGALRVREALRDHDALVLARHGSLCLGATLEDAWVKTETLEQLARICAILRGVGQSNLTGLRLPPNRLQELETLRRSLGRAREADIRDAASEDDQGA
ncbi:MAG: class II aldolase/adducin family protein [Chloroflexi bacterium]|nr:class II aldolase/adducin family protein [Chloroflexota bacterium]